MRYCWREQGRVVSEGGGEVEMSGANNDDVPLRKKRGAWSRVRLAGGSLEA